MAAVFRPISSSEAPTRCRLFVRRAVPTTLQQYPPCTHDIYPCTSNRSIKDAHLSFSPVTREILSSPSNSGRISWSSLTSAVPNFQALEGGRDTRQDVKGLYPFCYFFFILLRFFTKYGTKKQVCYVPGMMFLPSYAAYARNKALILLLLWSVKRPVMPKELLAYWR